MTYAFSLGNLCICAYFAGLGLTLKMKGWSVYLTPNTICDPTSVNDKKVCMEKFWGSLVTETLIFETVGCFSFFNFFFQTSCTKNTQYKYKSKGNICECFMASVIKQ